MKMSASLSFPARISDSEKAACATSSSFLSLRQAAPGRDLPFSREAPSLARVVVPQENVHPKLLQDLAAAVVQFAWRATPRILFRHT